MAQKCGSAAVLSASLRNVKSQAESAVQVDDFMVAMTDVRERGVADRLS